jgi:hypothetical protein
VAIEFQKDVSVVGREPVDLEIPVLRISIPLARRIEYVPRSSIQANATRRPSGEMREDSTYEV